MIRCLAMVAIVVVSLAQPSLAQEPDISAAILAGTCSDASAVAVAQLAPPVVPSGTTIGATEAQTAGSSYTTVAMSFADLTETSHAIVTATGETRTACGEIGGIPFAAGGLALVLTASSSGVGGIAYVQAEPTDPASTGVSLFVGGGVLDGIDDASVARSGAEPGDEGTAAAVVEETAAPSKFSDQDSSSDAAGAATPSPSNDSGSREDPLPIDTVAEIGGGWVAAVIDVNPDAAEVILAENSFNVPPEPGQQYFMVTISATYTGPEASSELPVGNSFMAVGDSSVTYYSFDPGCGVTPNEFPRTEVFSGGTIWGTICFAINSADADSLVMFTEDFLNQSDTRVWFALR